MACQDTNPPAEPRKFNIYVAVTQIPQLFLNNITLSPRNQSPCWAQHPRLLQDSASNSCSASAETESRSAGPAAKGRCNGAGAGGEGSSLLPAPFLAGSPLCHGTSGDAVPGAGSRGPLPAPATPRRGCGAGCGPSAATATPQSRAGPPQPAGRGCGEAPPCGPTHLPGGGRAGPGRAQPPPPPPPAPPPPRQLPRARQHGPAQPSARRLRQRHRAERRSPGAEGKGEQRGRERRSLGRGKMALGQPGVEDGFKVLFLSGKLPQKEAVPCVPDQQLSCFSFSSTFFCMQTVAS